MLFAPTRTCRCVPVHLLCTRIPTCRALVTIRTLPLTNPGPLSSHEANPNMHRSATIVRASCVETATGCSDSVVFFETFVGTCCSVTLVCASLTSRSPLRCEFFSCRLTPTNLSVRLCFRLRCLPSSQHHRQCHRCCLLESPCIGPVLVSLVTSPVVVVLACGAAGLCTSSPALCTGQFSSEAPTRDDRRHPSSVCLSWINGRVSFS